MVNCQSIKNKVPILQESIDYTKPDIIIGSESWLSPDYKNSEIFPLDFQTNVFRKDRNKNGGGVFIAVHDKFRASEGTCSVNTSDCELVWAELQTKTKSVMIGSYYRPPNANINSLNNLNDSIKNITNQNINKPILIAGDFNLPHINWNNNTVVPSKPQADQHFQLLNIIEEHSLEQLQLNRIQYLRPIPHQQFISH